MSKEWPRSHAWALAAAAAALGLIIGGAFGAISARPTSSRGPNVEFTGDVSIQHAASLQFHQTGPNATIELVLPVTSNNQVKGVLVGGTSYSITAYDSNHTSICNSAVYIPAINATFATAIVCG